MSDNLTKHAHTNPGPQQTNTLTTRPCYCSHDNQGDTLAASQAPTLIGI